MTEPTESVEAQNKRCWAEFNAQYEQLEAEYLQEIAANNRRFNRRMRMIDILSALWIVPLIILAWVRLGALE